MANSDKSVDALVSALESHAVLLKENTTAAAELKAYLTARSNPIVNSISSTPSDASMAPVKPAAPVNEFVLEIEGLIQTFVPRRGAEGFTVRVPQRLSFPRGGFIAIKGANGCGKTTLMTVLSLLRRPSNLNELALFNLHIQEVIGDEKQYDLKAIWHAERMGKLEEIRRRHLGFCPQQLELLPSLNVRETIGLAPSINAHKDTDIRNIVQELLAAFDLVEKQYNRIDRVSVGQQQKTTIARAIAHNPSLVFLDEPTAALHPKTAHEALQGLRRRQKQMEGRVTVIMITHDHDLAKEFATRVIEMNGDGKHGWVEQIVDQTPSFTP